MPLKPKKKLSTLYIKGSFIILTQLNDLGTLSKLDIQTLIRLKLAYLCHHLAITQLRYLFLHMDRI